MRACNPSSKGRSIIDRFSAWEEAGGIDAEQTDFVTDGTALELWQIHSSALTSFASVVGGCAWENEWDQQADWRFLPML